MSSQKDHAPFLFVAGGRWHTLAVLAALGGVASIPHDVAHAAAPDRFQVEEVAIADIHAAIKSGQSGGSAISRVIRAGGKPQLGQ